MFSIPLWFPRNAFGRKQKRFCYLFPYHYGSHATLSKWRPSAVKKVSIPLWFSRNKNKPDFISLEESFHTTMVLTQRDFGHFRLQLRTVSIPLWFSRNPETAEIIRWIPVSIPLWFSRNATDPDYANKLVRFHTTMVLTQPCTRTR